MKISTSFARAICATIVACASVSITCGQSASVPLGTFVAATLPRTFTGSTAGALPAATLALPQTGLSLTEVSENVARSEAKWRKQWAISLAPLMAAQTLDAASSYGLRELNPLLASSNGGFGMKAVAIKFGTVGGLVAVEAVLVRKHPRTAKVLTVMNWAAAGLTASFAVHNYNLQ